MTEMERQFPTEESTRVMLRHRVHWLRTTAVPVPIYIRGPLADEIEHLLDQLAARDYDNQERDDSTPDTRRAERNPE